MLEFAAAAIKLSSNIEKTYAGRYIAGQMLRSASSAGANYEEACSAESRADFIHKLQIVLKELRETVYWLRLSQRSGLLGSDEPLLETARSLTNIIAKSIITAKSNR
ncbi:MAG TPA: four helix bundle protein [Candidatus Edwardsbacteria bacterium]|nr:four helix bundle protein [Candidatus Edwardsbacteria bacterium]